MRKVYYNKLIRDKIPERIRSKGSACSVETLMPHFFEYALLRKVGEEASALPVVLSRNELIEELADVLDVIDEIKQFKSITDNEIAIKRAENEEKKGGFRKRLYLVWSEDDGYVSNEQPYQPSTLPPLQ